MCILETIKEKLAKEGTDAITDIINFLTSDTLPAHTKSELEDLGVLSSGFPNISFLMALA